MAMQEWEARYGHVRRATTGRNVLGWLALAFLFGFGYFWLQVWEPLFAPPSWVSPQMTITVIVSVVYTVVLPLFLSMVVPNSPAGNLLRRQTWAIPGQIAVVIFTVLLLGVALYVFRFWLEAQPNVMETGMYYPALLAMVVGGIGVPALTWAVATPEQLIALYHQARVAAQLEQQAQLEDLKAKALHARFCAVVNSDMRSLTIKQFGEVVEEMTTILATGARQEARRYQALADTFKQIYGVELAGAPDPKEADQTILHQYRYIGSVLTNAAENYVTTADYGEQQLIDVTPEQAVIEQAAQHVAPHSNHVNRVVGHAVEQRVVAAPDRMVPHGAAPYGNEYEAARRSLGGAMWSTADLANALDCAPRTADNVRAAWVTQGLIKPGRKGSWMFTEHVEVQ